MYFVKTQSAGRVDLNNKVVGELASAWWVVPYFDLLVVDVVIVLPAVLSRFAVAVYGLLCVHKFVQADSFQCVDQQLQNRRTQWRRVSMIITLQTAPWIGIQPC